jgi:serine/threonine protein kinase
VDKAAGGRPAHDASTCPLETSDPRTIGSYEVVARLGFGGMGTVYLGRDQRERNVAIKLVHPHLASDPEFRARFAAEASAGQRLPAFCSARVIGVGNHEERPYLVAEYIEGAPLSRLVQDDGPLDLSSLHALALGTAAGLAAIHSAGLIHRDVKPSNIIMTLGGVRIIDFGIARALEDTSGYTRTGIVMGSLGWAAPEQLEGATPSPSMDIFGWGCVVGYAATGEHPFGGSGGPNTRAWRIVHGEPDTTGVPEPLRPLVASALSHVASERPSAERLLLALVGAAPSGLSTLSGPSAPSDAGPRRLTSKNRPRRATGAFAVAVPLAVALIAGAAGAAGLQGAEPAVSRSGAPGPTEGPAQHAGQRPVIDGASSVRPGESGWPSREPPATTRTPSASSQAVATAAATSTAPTSVPPAPTLPGRGKTPKVTPAASDSPTPDPALT